MIIHLGESGINSYLKITSKDEEIGDTLYIQDCISLTLDDRSYLDSKDLSIIKTIGLKFKGKRAYPLFHRYKPYYYPLVFK